jgi:hypothetical protein
MLILECQNGLDVSLAMKHTSPRFTRNVRQNPAASVYSTLRRAATSFSICSKGGALAVHVGESEAEGSSD